MNIAWVSPLYKGNILSRTEKSGLLYRLQHCTENSKHIFPETKLRGLIPNFYIHVYESYLYIPMMGLIWNLYFPVLYCVRELSTQPQERREGQGTAANHRLAAVPCAALPSDG